jgi:hypothetical protein
MTFAELYRWRYQDNVHCHGAWCPSTIYPNCFTAPYYDKETAIIDNRVVVGCRGITCEQCWDTEVRFD